MEGRAQFITLMEGCAQFITLQSPGNRTLTIINVYAPRFSNDIAQFWRNINQADLNSDHIILGGDFNHQEVTDSRGITGERQIHRR
jgi:4-hydroxy-3-methylbut-2-enyl diphosphate reductase IspH